MTVEQFTRACDETARLLRARVGDSLLAGGRDPDLPTHPHHLAWMLGEAPGFYAGGKVEKANRWLGYVQGVMAALKLAGLDELKAANMPEGAEFDAARI